MDGLAMQSTERNDSEQAATALELRRKRAAVLELLRKKIEAKTARQPE